MLHPINVDLNNITWPKLESVLDGYTSRITATNICDSWLEAEKYIDQSCDNYIVLMTDGHDNVGGTANEANRTAFLGRILQNFCGKYQNTKGFYVELTKAASLPAGIQNAIDICSDLYKIDASGGIPAFGCFSDDAININTRDLPIDIHLSFSNAGTFTANLLTDDNPYVKFSIKDGKISRGKAVLRVESKFGNDIAALNKAIDAPTAELGLQVRSEEVFIPDRELDVILHTTPLRTLDIPGTEAWVDRTAPFLWIKGNPCDTLSWNLQPDFNGAAMADGSSAIFRLRADTDLSDYAMQFNGESLAEDSILVIRSGEPAVLDIIVPRDSEDRLFNLSLNEISTRNLDRINGAPTRSALITLAGSVGTSLGLAEIIFWCTISLIALLLIIWFGLIRNRKYPKFKRGIITVKSPYYGTVKVKGHRKVIFTPHNKKQGFMDRLFKGTILYHVNAAWPCEAEVTPAGRNMHFRSASGGLVCSPQPRLMRGCSYEIINTATSDPKIEIEIN